MWQQLKNIGHLLLAESARIYYRNPASHIKVIGITGTDGKTTTSSLIAHILISSGKKTSMITTVSATIAGKSYDTGFHVTTPSAFAVQKYISLAVAHGDEYFVLETTSHALDQSRVRGVHFCASLITNVTHEHLQYHKTYDAYVKAKARIAQNSDVTFINSDDRSFKSLSTLLQHKNVRSYGYSASADVQKNIESATGLRLASFNKSNYLGAYALLHEVGLKDEDIFASMRSFTLPPGRMETVYDEKFTVIVDFAHTPNALHEALGSIRAMNPLRRILHIFGAAAFRDDSKRPLMGKESATYSDLVILTEEDYRTENPVKICNEIANGMKDYGFSESSSTSFGTKNKMYFIETDRRKAIKKALSIAQKNDIIVLTGKGHEQSLCRGTKEFPWDEKNAVLEELKNLHS